VLVLTANHTRRESALRAKEQLLQCNAELLGAVLDGRTFPIPKAVYQRL
jgi:Mrp family chromosome partitioning ATPase